MRRVAGWLLGTALALAVPVPAWADDAQACDRSRITYLNQEPAAFGLLGIPSAWQLSTGSGVRVAIVDSGVDATNQHLAGAIDPGRDFVGGSTAGRTDLTGHGTAVAGLIAARQVNGSGLRGVAPDARIVPVRVYESEEDGRRHPDAAVTAEGIRWAARQPGVRIIVVPSSTASESPALEAAVRDATRQGALVVASAGNADSGKDTSDAVVFPAGYPDVLSVTAVDNTGKPSDAVRRGVHVELAAPGAGVLTTYFDAGDCVLAEKPSTSYAAGYVAGVAALVAAAHPAESPADWEYRLLATALRPAGADRDKLVGWGIVAPSAAINFVNDGSRPGPANPRFPAPETSVAPVVVPPAPGAPATSPAPVVGGIGIGAIALVAAGLLWRRLRAR